MNNQVKAPPQNNPLAPGSPIQERIQKWKLKKAREELGIRFGMALIDGKKNKFRLKPEAKKDSPYNHQELIESLHSTVTGSGNDTYARRTITEALAPFSNGNSKIDEVSEAFYGAMLGMEPRDIIESQLCARLLILNSKANNYISLAAMAETHKSISLYINSATKLMRLYNETLETLNRYKRKGEQKIIVQHINVNRGAQAVVTGEFTGGGGNSKNTKV